MSLCLYDSRLGCWELGGSRLGWRKLVGSRPRSAEHDAIQDDQTHATLGSRELMELGGSRLGTKEARRLQAEAEGA